MPRKPDKPMPSSRSEEGGAPRRDRWRGSPFLRRAFLRRVGLAAGALATGPGLARAAHGGEPTITFPDGTALVLDRTRGPLEAAVRTKRVFMPEGGWVVISTGFPPVPGENVIGHSTQRLPAGHFESLLVAVAALDPGIYTLYATLFKGDRGDAFPGDGPGPYENTHDSAEITFA